MSIINLPWGNSNSCRASRENLIKYEIKILPQTDPNFLPVIFPPGIQIVDYVQNFDAIVMDFEGGHKIIGVINKITNKTQIQ